MVNIRGVNVYPVGIESVVRRFDRGRGVPLDRVAARLDALAALEIEVAPEFEDSNAVAVESRVSPARGARADGARCRSSRPGRCRGSR